MEFDRFVEAACKAVGDSLEVDPVELAERVRRKRDWRLRRALRPFKVCPDCGEEKAAREFAENTHRPDGLEGICRACRTRRDSTRNSVGPIHE